MLETVVLCQNIADRIGVAGLESHQRRVHDALVFAGEFFADQSFQLISVEIENLRDQPENEDVFAFVLRGAAKRLDGQTCDWHADVNEPLVIEIWLNVVRIVEQHAAVAQETDVVLVTVLVKRDQKIGFVACRQHFTGTDAYLENGRTTRNRRGDGHVGHDVVLAAPGKAREKGAGGLNSVLRISREPDDRVLNAFGPQIRSLGVRRGCLCSSIRSIAHGIRKLTD